MSTVKRKEEAVHEDAAVTKMKRNPSEIPPPTKSGKSVFFDDIFNEKKKKRQLAEASAKEANFKKKKRLDETIPKTSGEKSVLESVFSKSSQKWVDDGLGGKFNDEGYTGRVEEGVKIFKAHVLNRPTAGSTKDCPFDCQCCFV
jgi:Eukaryotic protein of unknown function (DUF1764)